MAVRWVGSGAVREKRGNEMGEVLTLLVPEVPEQPEIKKNGH